MVVSGLYSKVQDWNSAIYARISTVMTYALLTGTFPPKDTVRLSKCSAKKKDQTVFFVVDVSASQQVGPHYRDKLEATKEVCGVLALSAIREANYVGLYCFSDQKERYIKPANGLKTGYQLIMSLYKLQPEIEPNKYCGCDPVYAQRA